jgi:hypothetical protein
MHGAIAYLAGDDVVVSQDAVTVIGDGRNYGIISVSNVSGEPTRIVGYTAGCSCVRLSDLPLALQPGGTAILHVRATSEISEDLTVALLTDKPGRAPIRIDVRVNGVKR